MLSKNVTVMIFELLALTSFPFRIHEIFFAPGIFFFNEHVTLIVLPLVPTIVSLGKICSSTKLNVITEKKQAN